jgi:glycosyltransferase involved in cell wall biosynthesis
MRIVVAHNFYQQPGGEDQVFAAEVELLRAHGHAVETYTVHNHRINQIGGVRRLAGLVWNRDTAAEMRRLVREHRAQVVHFHNTFPLISPAAYKAARTEGAAVVQTLHNFRLLAPCALLFRKGAVCEKCLGRQLAWPGIIRGCYRKSCATTAATAGMVAIHRVMGTWQDAVDLYLAPTPSARSKFVEGGLPADKIIVKPNFLDPDPGMGEGDGGYAVMVCRLSEEKGVGTALAAWTMLSDVMPLKIVGDGPLAASVREAAASNPRIEWLGRRPLNEVCDLIGRASLLVFPSRCYETFGRVIVEAFAKGTPVVASRMGAMADLVDHGRTGALFSPGNPADLAAQVRWLAESPERIESMRQAARREFELRYTGAINHDLLMRAYHTALGDRASRPAATGDVPAVPVAPAVDALDFGAVRRAATETP